MGVDSYARSAEASRIVQARLRVRGCRHSGQLDSGRAARPYRLEAPNPDLGLPGVNATGASSLAPVLGGSGAMAGSPGGRTWAMTPPSPRTKLADVRCDAASSLPWLRVPPNVHTADCEIPIARGGDPSGLRVYRCRSVSGLGRLASSAASRRSGHTKPGPKRPFLPSPGEA
jgi:hypothetical protein